MVQIAGGCAAHTVFVLTVAPHVSLPGWQPVPSALGWPSAMYVTAVCHHSGVVLLGGCLNSLGCYRLPPAVLATWRHQLLRAYTGCWDVAFRWPSWIVEFPPMGFFGTFSMSFGVIFWACYELIECLACDPNQWSWTIKMPPS